jgi:hypothetical protein
MASSIRSAPPPGRWISLRAVALVSLVAQLALCQFFYFDQHFSFGVNVPFSEDINPSKLWELAYHFPPSGTFQVLNWLGVAYPAQPLNPLSIASACLSPWFFFTSYVPVMSTLALLAMAAFLRELEISRAATLFGAVIYAWQGDVLAFIYPGHYGYLTSWPFFALAAWGALRAQRTGRWPYAVLSGVNCGLMVGLLTNADRGGIASLVIAALLLAPLARKGSTWRPLRHFLLCVAVAFLVALAPLLALYKGNIAGVKLGGEASRTQTYNFVTQYSLGPAETLTYLVPGFFGWHSNNRDGLYWGWIGEWPDWEKNQKGPANLNLAISTSGTLATLLALVGASLLLPGRLLGAQRLSPRQLFFARVLLAAGLVSLVLSWGRHTFIYPVLFHLPLMDKWRDPLKWLEGFNFAIMPLSALGVDHLLRTLAPEDVEAKIIRRRLLFFLTVVFVALIAGLVISYATASVFVLHFLREGIDQVTVADMLSTLHGALGGAIVLTVLLGIVPWACWNAEKLRRVSLVNPLVQRAWEAVLAPAHLATTMALGLALLSAVQLGWVARHFIESVPLDAIVATNPLLDTLAEEGPKVRVTVAVEDLTLNVLLQNQFAGLGISCLDISAASRIPDDYGTFLHDFDNGHARLWFLAGVKNVVVPQAGLDALRAIPEVSRNIAKIDGYTIAATDSPDLPSHALVVLRDYLSKATFVPNVERLTADETLKRLIDPAWNPRRLLLLEKTGATAPAPSYPNSQADVAVTVYTPTEIEIAADSTEGGYVLVNDQFDPDWETQVNGQPAVLVRADFILRAVAIPPGKSTITMHYVPHYLGVPAVAWNLFSDGAMVLAWLVSAVALWRKPDSNA